jgi:hypothetical protein
MLDFNRANISDSPVSVAINELIERAEPPEENTRQYLGASSAGSECLRRVQYDWMVDPQHTSRTRDIFARGHFFEEVSRQHLVRAGFCFAPAERLRFVAADGLLRGHADGILIAGPELPGVGFPCVWEHKGLGSKGWRAIERDGVEKAYPHYAAQVWLYQAYLNVTDHPALFTVTNADTCERLHLLLPFNAEQAQQASDRAVAVIEATRAGELLQRVSEDPKDWRCKMCGHRERCWRSSQ